MKLIGMALLFCALTGLRSETYNVVGPAQPLFTVAGEDVVLPCHIKPNTSAVDMTVEWFRLDQHSSVVHLYKNHENRITEQSEPYRGRTALFHEELQNGNASLKLSAVQLSDQGVYKCFIESSTWYDDIIVQINVGAIGSHPLITIEEFDHSGGLRLLCQCEGWNPKPELLWLDSKGEVLISDGTESDKNAEGYIVKHRITVHRSESRFHCRVRLKHHMIQTDISVSSKMFNVWKRLVVGISIAVVFIVISAVTLSVFLYVRRGDLFV